MRLLLILRRLTDIQSELVLYRKLSAGSGGLWDKNWQGKIWMVQEHRHLAFCLLFIGERGK